MSQSAAHPTRRSTGRSTRSATGQPPAGSGDARTVIRTSGLVKTFGTFRALDGLDLEVARGEVHGFLGPNGSGKSTTLRVLLGLLRASAGTAELLGGDPWKDVVALHRRLAYVPGDVVLWPKLTGGETVDLLGHLRGGLDPRRRDELVERFELDPTKRGREYSKGNRQKVALVAALASDVELLVLDEPTSGLDPLMEAVFKDELSAARDRGTTVLLSSHILSEVEALADRVSIIRRGRVVQTGTLEELRARLRVTVRATVARPPQDRAGLDVLTDLSVDGRHLAGSVAPADLNRAMAALVPLELAELTVTPATLEQVFLEQYGDRAEADDA